MAASDLGVGGQLFARRCRLVVAPPAGYRGVDPRSVTIENLRVVFRVKKKLDSKPNQAEISVYNLAESSRALMQSKGSRIILAAGYDDAMGVVFFGDSETIDHRHDGPNWITKIEAKDAGRAYLNARVSESFAGGTRLGTAIMRVVEAMGLGAGDLVARLPDINASFAFEHGWAVHGRAAPELTRLLRMVGLRWSAQDGDLVVYGDDETGESLVYLDEDHGMIGTPEHGTSENKGQAPLLKLRSLLQYQLRIAGRVRVKSRRLDGTYQVRELEHEGDTDGGPWYSHLEVKAAT